MTTERQQFLINQFIDRPRDEKKFKIKKEGLRFIFENYPEAKMTVSKMAKHLGINSRTIPRVIADLYMYTGGEVDYRRTIAEANKVTAKLKNYSANRVPEWLKKKRKWFTTEFRYMFLSNFPECVVCGATRYDGAKIEIDHIDGNPSNNNLKNLQTLCHQCNYGKYMASKNKKTK